MEILTYLNNFGYINYIHILYVVYIYIYGLYSVYIWLIYGSIWYNVRFNQSAKSQETAHGFGQQQNEKRIEMN